MLPKPPSGSHWEITGTPTGPWVWTSGSRYEHDANGFARSVEYYGIASAPGATAIWVIDA